MIKCSCQGCEKRTKNCHSTCEDYKAYSQALRDRRHIEWKKRVEEGAANGYIKKQKAKCAIQRGDKYES